MAGLAALVVASRSPLIQRTWLRLIASLSAALFWPVLMAPYWSLPRTRIVATGRRDRKGSGFRGESCGHRGETAGGTGDQRWIDGLQLLDYIVVDSITV